MRYCLLGNLAVANEDGTPVSIPAAKRRALLAILLLQRGRPIQRAALIDALWGDEAPDAAHELLFTHVSRLRREIGADAIRTVPGGYVLPLQDGELDVIAFEHRVAAGRRALINRQWLGASVALAEAVDQWQGAALAEFCAEAFAQPEITRLEQLRAAALEDRIDADLELRLHAEVIPELERLIQEHPLRERLWSQLMLSLYRSGRQSEALDRFRELRRTLVADLGLDPSPDLQELQRRILRQDPALAAPAPPGRIVDLPATPTRTVGRQHEIELTRKTLAGNRLLTLTGPGGVGKTRLAVLVAESLLSEHPDGTQFVDLSMVRDPERVLERIGSAVGGGGRPEDAIGQRRMLLVLDNFEQVLDAAGSVAALLARCPSLKVIVTSRAPLRIGAERQFEVPPLGRSDAAELFVDRASAALATEALPPELVGEVVARLDGLPLAVELAAARIKVLTIDAIRDFLADRMSFLTASPRDASDRHRTLRNTIRWSYDLLDPGVRAAFRKLSVLAPGFDLEAALAVSDGDLDQLAELVDHSLLRRTGDRYSMLETIRAFAEEAADETETRAALTRHIRHFAALPSTEHLQPWGGEADPQARDRWLEVCESNQENLRLAFARATEMGDAEAIVELFLGVGLYWALLGTTEEVARWTTIALESGQTSRPQELERVRRVAAEFARFDGRLPLALELLGLALASATERGDLVWIGNTLDDMAVTHAFADEYDEAWALLARAQETHRVEAYCEPGHREHTIGSVISILLRQNRVAEAESMLEEFTAAHLAAPTDRLRHCVAELLRGQVAGAAGRHDEARDLFIRAITESAGLKFRGTLAEALEGLAGIERYERPVIATRLIGMADRVRAESRAVDFYHRQRQLVIDQLREVLGPDAYEAARSAGHAVSMTEIAASALPDIFEPPADNTEGSDAEAVAANRQAPNDLASLADRLAREAAARGA